MTAPPPTKPTITKKQRDKKDIKIAQQWNIRKKQKLTQIVYKVRNLCRSFYVQIHVVVVVTLYILDFIYGIYVALPFWMLSF